MDRVARIAGGGDKDVIPVFVLSGHIDVVGEIEEAVALRAPTGVEAVAIGAVRAKEGNRPHDFDSVRINDAFDLDDLIGATAGEDIELRLAGLCDGRMRIQPVAEDTRAIAAKVHA